MTTINGPTRPMETISLQESAETITRLDNGGSYSRAAGSIFGAPDHIRRAYAAQANIPLVDPPTAMVATLRNVSVHSRGVLIDGSGRAILESLINTEGLTDFGPFRRRRIWDRNLQIIENVAPAPRNAMRNAVLLKQMWDDNYGHWLIETLPRVGMLGEAGDIGAYKFIVGGERNKIGQVYIDTLELAGIHAKNIVRLDEPAMFDELVYPSPITFHPWIKAPRVIQFLENLQKCVPGVRGGAKKIHVIRGRTTYRTLRNEAEVAGILAAQGFVTLDPGELDFARQVQAFQDATHVVGNLGATLTNIVFAPRGVKLLALTTELMQDDFFGILSA